MDALSIFLGIIAGILVLSAIASIAKKISLAANQDPALWEGGIRWFEKADEKRMPPSGVIVFTGSSSIRFWKTLEEDMAPLPVVNRGFGGSQIHEVVHFADRIVLPYKPRAVVLYAGENDVAGVMFSKGKPAEQLLETFERFCESIHAELPGTVVYFISIKPPKRRWEHWEEMQRANRLIEEFIDTDERLHYIDVSSAMLDEEGKTRTELFKWDGIHMNQGGYAIWTSIVKPVLVQAFET
jgi:lysophospholipase L1-like esterase